MALPHAQPGQALPVQPYGERLAEHKTCALFKSVDLEVMRVVLRAGKSLPPHRVPGEITIQCLEGSLIVVAGGEERPLAAGELLFLRGDVMHSLRARSDASALVTVALK